MFFIYLGKNGCGKTHKLNEEYGKVKDDKIFFPCASEILSMINGEQNKNCLGTNGKRDESKTYDNAIISLIKLISNKTNSEKNIKNAICKISKATNEFQEKITKGLKKIFNDNDSDDHECEYARFENELIKSYVNYNITWYSKKSSYISFFDILNKKNKFLNKDFSHGQLSFSIMKFCLKLIKKYELKLSLFFDEPDNYLNPERINELVNLMSSINNCFIYISSHNPYFISHLLNKVERKDIELYRLEAKQSGPKREDKCQKIKINEKQYIVPSLLIYEIYNVCTIDLLDFYIGEIGRIKSNEKINNKLDTHYMEKDSIIKNDEKINNRPLYKFDGSWKEDEEIVKNDDKVERVYKYFINKKRQWIRIYWKWWI